MSTLLTDPATPFIPANMKFLTALAFCLFCHTIKAGEHPHGELGIPQPKPDPSKAQIPATPLLVEPATFAKVASASVVLRWNPVQNAQWYHVQVASDPAFKWLVVEKRLVQDTQLAVELRPGVYFWRVYAINPDKDPGYIRSDFQVSTFEVLSLEGNRP